MKAGLPVTKTKISLATDLYGQLEKPKNKR